MCCRLLGSYSGERAAHTQQVACPRMVRRLSHTIWITSERTRTADGLRSTHAAAQYKQGTVPAALTQASALPLSTCGSWLTEPSHPDPSSRTPPKVPLHLSNTCASPSSFVSTTPDRAVGAFRISMLLLGGGAIGGTLCCVELRSRYCCKKLWCVCCLHRCQVKTHGKPHSCLLI